MTTVNKLVKSTISLSMIGLLIFASSCTKQEEAPDLPPEGSFAINFDNFNDGTADGKNEGIDSTAQNYLFAGTHVLIWNVVLTLNLAVPVAAFAESFNHDAEWDRKKKVFVWTYDFTAGATYTARLEGSKDGDSHVKWEMYISKSGGFQDVLWYSGSSAVDGSSASWTLNRDGDNPTAYLQIDYTKSSTDAKIKYTEISGGDADGSYIIYGKNSDTTFDRFYDIYAKKDDNLVEIAWNSTTRKGQVKNLAKYGDTDAHCWDENLKDAVCE